MNRLSELHAQLSDEWRLLNVQWQHAEMHWRDNSQHKVAGTFWSPIEQTVPAALRELEEMIRLVEVMQRRVDP